MNKVVPLLGLALIVAGIIWRLKRPAAPKHVQPRMGGSELAAGAPPSPDTRASRRGPLFAGKRDSEWDEAPDIAPSVLAEKHRRSERILLRIPVQVEGTDADGKLFTERTFTLFVNRHGGCINLRSSPRVNDQITMTNLQTRQSCPFRVCESHQDRPGDLTEWGLECLEPNRNFWGVHFPEKAPQPSLEQNINTMLECVTCRSLEMTELSPGQYRRMAEQGVLTRDCQKCGAATEWKFGFVVAEEEEPFLPSIEPATPAVSLPKGAERRREKRLIAKLPIRIRHGDGRVENSMTQNVAKSGACFASNLEMKVGETVFLTYQSGLGPREEESPARIMWRRDGAERGKILYGVNLERAESRKDDLM